MEVRLREISRSAGSNPAGNSFSIAPGGFRFNLFLLGVIFFMARSPADFLLVPSIVRLINRATRAWHSRYLSDI